ncbi:hypothetical protein [Candidatus Walczuchella endosymbiont of Icerya purchasi]|uniref:hypothetical protein n=1 Tax=Candidatus Walczuchella endosymbiont of Icerya purchasi TaxID=3066219 RepID=UPI00313AFBE2
MKIIRYDIEELNEKLKSADKQQATIEFYKKIVINPMSGFFMHCFNFFKKIINLRGKSFLWAYDLTYYDSVFHLPIPIYPYLSLFMEIMLVYFILYTKFSHINNYVQVNNNNISCP